MKIFRNVISNVSNKIALIGKSRSDYGVCYALKKLVGTLSKRKSIG